MRVPWLPPVVTSPTNRTVTFCLLLATSSTKCSRPKREPAPGQRPQKSMVFATDDRLN